MTKKYSSRRKELTSEMTDEIAQRMAEEFYNLEQEVDQLREENKRLTQFLNDREVYNAKGMKPCGTNTMILGRVQRRIWKAIAILRRAQYALENGGEGAEKVSAEIEDFVNDL